MKRTKSEDMKPAMLALMLAETSAVFVPRTTKYTD